MALVAKLCGHLNRGPQRPCHASILAHATPVAPQGAKSSADITYMERARALGATIITEAAVSRVLSDDRTAIGVEYFDSSGTCVHLHGQHIVLAASLDGTPRILLNSKSDEFPNGLANTSDQVGRNLMIHPLGFVEGILTRHSTPTLVRKDA